MNSTRSLFFWNEAMICWNETIMSTSFISAGIRFPPTRGQESLFLCVDILSSWLGSLKHSVKDLLLVCWTVHCYTLVYQNMDFSYKILENSKIFVVLQFTLACLPAVEKEQRFAIFTRLNTKFIFNATIAINEIIKMTQQCETQRYIAYRQ